MTLNGSLRRLAMVGMLLLITIVLGLVPVGNAEADDYLDWLNFNTLNALQPSVNSLQTAVNSLQTTVDKLQKLSGDCSDSATTTRLLFPFVTNQGGFDTGWAISNTTSDPFGTTHVAGTCTLSFFGDGAPASFTTANIAAGTTYTDVASSRAPGFQGYVIAVCHFPLAHAFVLLSDLGARNLAANAPVVNICAPRVAPQ